MAGDVSLVQLLASALPKAVRLRVLHVSTHPSPVDALFATASGQQEGKTYCESHLITIATVPTQTVSDILLIYAIEILIFTIQSQTTLFISKADSSGYLHLLNPPKSVPSIVKTLTTTTIQHLLNARLSDPSVVLSLFARAQPQYLFPGSSDYAGKHVLNDRHLIKWWCQALDAVVRGQRSPQNKHQNADDIKAYLVIPGLDSGETRSFFPSSARLDASERVNWLSSYPVSSLAPTTEAPLRCLIPRLPDDPKARFLTDLDAEADESGQWRSVKSLDQFWEMMSFRQECAAGRLVGFMWAILPKQSSQVAVMQTTERDATRATPTLGDVRSLPTPSGSFVDDTSPVVCAEISVKKSKPAHPRAAQSPPPSSPILPLVDDDEDDRCAVPCIDTGRFYYDDLASAPVRWPEGTRGQLILDEDQYQDLVEHLLQLDFSNQTLAADGSRSFIEKALQISGAETWGRDIIGQKEMAQPSQQAQNEVPTINLLMGVRKKRKVENVDRDGAIPAETEPGAIILGSDLVRKKPKG